MNVSSESVMELETVVNEYESTYGSVIQPQMSEECDCKDAGCGRSCAGSCEGGCDSSCYSTTR